ncbi:Uncharacterized protein PRO82_001838 [Candidatus Protochlamydia amoebophila]|uniref:hypothetical protein n=1 Tax=Candidatus Protochlamydia amoebophila TaxID=362787 RepID=UPI001BCA5B26|nr:hypothetical protein [Candidatus Protochlamydia amoebophila]MBS4164509.1 Uncharacterized protein [Candidatus Protochlamydia amoebophila]
MDFKVRSYFLSLITICILSTLTSCCPSSSAYRELYSHLRQYKKTRVPMKEENYFLIILVNARHLDYTDTRSFFHTVAKHPRDATKNGDLGHAWIYLQGNIDGRIVVIEGGHSGERGMTDVRYFDGIMNYNDWGYVNPTLEQRKHPCYEPNPAKYLWATLNDGYFQQGTGGHKPTYAAKISLTKQQFNAIIQAIKIDAYPYHYYSLTQQQCSNFVSKISELAGLKLESEIAMPIYPSVWYRGQMVRLWEDPQYSVIKLATPDILEKSLMKAVQKGNAEYALDWYLNNKSRS